MKKTLFLASIFCLMAVISAFAQEMFYFPVDVGQNVDTNYVNEEKLSESDAKDIFLKDTASLSKKYMKKIEKLRDDWMKLNDKEYKKKFNSDKLFKVDKDAPVSVVIHEFSKSTVRIYIVFAFGHSSWQHYYILMKNYIVSRNDFVDDVFDLKELEEQYSFVFKKIGYGSTTIEMYKKLGKKYVEYEGQSPTFRNIYYEKYDIEVVIQDQVIKYLKKGKPGWVSTETKE